MAKTDIFVYDIASSTNEQITNDLADDAFPRFIDNDTKIIFSSDRMSDTLSSETDRTTRSLTSDLFIYDYAEQK